MKDILYYTRMRLTRSPAPHILYDLVLHPASTRIFFFRPKPRAMVNAVRHIGHSDWH